jgi:hypothetical protein
MKKSILSDLNTFVCLSITCLYMFQYVVPVPMEQDNIYLENTIVFLPLTVCIIFVTETNLLNKKKN